MKMTKKTTKRALVSSLVMIALCFTMLVGTTFAWFTDSASSTGNVITTGTLDVKLTQYNATENKYVEVTGPVFDNVLWEPNATYVEYFRVENAGTLALKFGVALNVTGVTKNLNEVLEYAVVEGTSLSSWTSGTAVAVGNNVTTVDGLTLAPGATYNFALAVHMDQDAGNTYQDASITFDVNVMATQATYESDSFGDQYDAGADAPVVATADAFVAALANGGEIALGADISVSDIVTITADTVIYGNGKTLTSTATGASARALNISGAANVTIKDLNVVGAGERAINIIQGTENVTLENVTATATNYALNVAGSAAGATVTVKNSTLSGLNAVNIGAANTTVNLSNCTIVCNDNTDTENYGAISLNNNATGSNVTVNACTFDVKGDSKAIHNAATGANVTVTDSNADVTNMVAYISYGDYAYSFTTIEAAFAKALDGETVVLLANANVETLAVNGNVNVNTNGFTFYAGTVTGGTVTVVN